MPKPASIPPSPPRPAGSLWPAFVLVALTSAATGALGLWAWIQAHPTAANRPATATENLTLPTPQEPPARLGEDPPPPETARLRGDFYYDRQNWPQAISAYQAALQQGQDDADLRTDLANALQFSGHGQEAVIQYQAAQRLDPQHEPSAFNLGVCYADTLNDPTRAIEAFRLFLQRFPNSAKAAQARQFLAVAQAAAAGMPPPGHPAPPDAGPATGATGSDAPADSDIQKLMQAVKPARR